jgi:hypothetical protein
VQGENIGLGQDIAESGVPEPKPLCGRVVGRCIERHDLHAEALRDRDHAPADPPGADHAEAPSLEIEPAQVSLREHAAARALDGLDQVAADRQQERKDVLGDGRIAVVGHVADGDAVRSAIVEVDV